MILELMEAGQHEVLHDYLLEQGLPIPLPSRGRLLEPPGDGYGRGSGSGSGNGFRSGFGSGFGFGHGFGSGSGVGVGFGSGVGDGASYLVVSRGIG